MKFKKLWMVIFMTLVLVGCSSKSSNPPANLLEAIKQKGEIVVATSPDYPPFEFSDPRELGQNQFVGADIELARYIAQKLGVKLSIQSMSFDDIPSAVSLKKYDLGLSGFSYTPDRAKVVDFTVGYNTTEGENQGFLVLDSNTFTSLADFNKATITMQNGSLQQALTEAQTPNATKRLTTSLDDAVMELKAGKTDAVAISWATAEAFLLNNSGIKISSVPFEITYEQGIMGIIPKGEKELLEQLDTIISSARDSGDYAKWLSDAKVLAAEVGDLGDVKPNIFTLAKAYGPIFIQGAIGTLWLSLIVVAFGTVFGALLALAKMTKFKLLNFIASAYIELVRGTPILLQLYLFVYGGAQFLPNMISDYVWVVIALVFNSSAYVAEVFRAGVQAVDKGQFEAAKSLGLSNKNMMVKVILPQAIKNILPALGNEFIMMIKETSLASIFFINSLMTSQAVVSAATHMKFETLGIVGIIYFILTFSLSKVVSYFERKGQANHV